MRPLTKQVREQIVAMRRAGVSIKIIAAELGIGTTSVKMHCYRAGMRSPERLILTDEQVARIEQMLADKVPYVKIAEEMGLTFDQARQQIYRLRKEGRLSLPPEQRRNRYLGSSTASPGVLLHDMLACGGFPAWREVEEGGTRAAGRSARRMKLIPSLYYPLRDAA